MLSTCYKGLVAGTGTFHLWIRAEEIRQTAGFWHPGGKQVGMLSTQWKRQELSALVLETVMHMPPRLPTPIWYWAVGEIVEGATCLSGLSFELKNEYLLLQMELEKLNIVVRLISSYLWKRLGLTQSK